MGMFRDRRLAISIHALRVEGDFDFYVTIPETWTFQSTPSVWRATLRPLYYKFFDSYFNPRPPCGGRPNKTEIVRAV